MDGGSGAVEDVDLAARRVDLDHGAVAGRQNATMLSCVSLGAWSSTSRTSPGPQSPMGWTQ